MSDYTIHVTDERWRPLDADMIRWELAGSRGVRVSAQFADGWLFHTYEARPQVTVRIREDDEWATAKAVIQLPENGPFGGIRAELVTPLLAVIERASAIASNANEIIRAAQAEYDAEFAASGER